MSALIVVLLVVVVALVVAAVGIVRAQREQEESVAAAEEAETRTDGPAGGASALRYHVPAGQDPAAVLAALETEGFRAAYEGRADTSDILILAPSGADRERAHARAVIRHAAIDMEGHPMPEHEIRFADEDGIGQP